MRAPLRPFLVFWALTAAWGQPAPWPTARWDASTPEAQGMDPQPLQAAGDYVLNQCPTRHTVLVIRHGYVVFERYYRNGNPETPQPIMSITKNVVSALTGIAVAQGLIRNEDQPVLDFFHEYAGAFDDPRKFNLRLRHLLTMTAGFAPANSIQGDDWFRATLARRMAHDPGEVFDYDNYLPHLLSGIVTRTSGRSTLELAQLHLFGPLGIRQLQWPRDPKGYYTGGGGISMRARDLAKLGYLYLRRGQWDGRQIVPASWIDESTSLQVKNDPVNYGGPSGYSMNSVGDYGYLWWLRTVRGHGVFFGAGACGQDLFVIPALDLVVVTMASTQTDSAEIGGQGMRILDYVVRAVKVVPPRLAPEGVLNAASFQPRLSPDSWVTLFGQDFTDRTESWETPGSLPFSLAGVSARIAGKACPMAFASPRQINLLLPPDTPAGASLLEVANSAGAVGLSVTVLAASPGIFTFPGPENKLRAAALFPNTATVAAPTGAIPGRDSRPARPGDILQLYATGLGSPADPASLEVWIDGWPAPITSALRTAAGLWQLNIAVPANARSGDVPVTVGTAYASSQDHVVITLETGDRRNVPQSP